MFSPFPLPRLNDCPVSVSLYILVHPLGSCLSSIHAVFNHYSAALSFYLSNEHFQVLSPRLCGLRLPNSRAIFFKRVARSNRSLVTQKEPRTTMNNGRSRVPLLNLTLTVLNSGNLTQWPMTNDTGYRFRQNLHAPARSSVLTLSYKYTPFALNVLIKYREFANSSIRETNFVWQ